MPNTPLNGSVSINHQDIPLGMIMPNVNFRKWEVKEERINFNIYSSVIWHILLILLSANRIQKRLNKKKDQEAGT